MKANKISGMIVNFDQSFFGELSFNEKIENIEEISNQESELFIIPGFVDLHCHGGGGFDTMQGKDAIKSMSEYHLNNGTTSLLATTWTSTFEKTHGALKDFNSLISENSNLLGVHLEGPFINPKKLGAQPALTQIPSEDFINEIIKEANVKTITLAPEIEGMEEFIAFLNKKNINLQFGHTLATSKCCEKFLDKYKVSFTHLYNAMSDNNHRNPGVLAAALSKGMFAEIICDLHHVSKEAIHIAKKCIPHLYAITDSIGASGLADGDYKFDKVGITKKGKQITLKDSETLAGSIITMHETFLNLLKIGISIEDAVKMTSYSASRFLNDNTIGYIKEGYKSNFIILNKDYNIEQIYMNGNLINE